MKFQGVSSSGGDSASTIEETIQTDNYTFQLTDAGTVVALDSATNKTFTIPRESDVPWPEGTVIEVYNAGAGLLTIDKGVGVTLTSPYNQTQLATQYASAVLRYRSSDVWTLDGNLA